MNSWDSNYYRIPEERGMTWLGVDKGFMAEVGLSLGL